MRIKLKFCVSMLAMSIATSAGAQTVEKQLMEDHGIHRNELFSLQPVNQEPGRTRAIEAGKLFLNEVQPLYGSAVIVLVVADDHAFGHAAHAARIA